MVIGTVAVLRPEKALEVLLEAFARIKCGHPGLRLLIAGGGPERERLVEQRRRLELENDCILLPPVRDVAGVLRALDVFVLSSRSEAFSNALLEAMACGCCVVGSNVGGTPEMIGDNERGLLCRPDDPADLAEKLGRLIQDAALRSELGKRASDFVRQNFSIEKSAARIAEIYEEILSGGAAHPG
jgi:glycosyltransferase involved in cell wall biosynthesis